MVTQTNAENPDGSLATRTFDDGAQRAFAALSGDWNPLHLDPEVARHTIHGAPVVHGVHQVLWALDAYLAESTHRVSLPLRIAATFPRPAFVGREVTLRSDRPRAGSGTVRLHVASSEGRTMELRLDAVTDPEPVWSPNPRAELFPLRQGPRELRFADAAGSAGAVETNACQAANLLEAFPVCCRVLGHVPTARLLALTRIVGMESPGLHSIFASFCATIWGDEQGDERLEFAVQGADERFQRFEIQVAGPQFTAELEAFYRPRPVVAPSCSTLAERVDPTEFEGQRALIIGASQGLGEATAKLLSCGGAEVMVTYFRGKGRAEDLVRDITRMGGRATAFQLDVCGGMSLVHRLQRLDAAAPSHVYYFATPKIFGWGPDLPELERLDEFNDYYVKGFMDVCEACASLAKPLRVFYPSTTALDRPVPGLTAYSMAKAAGEELCEHLNCLDPRFDVTVSRLPRVLTDQTATVTRVAAEDAATVMLPILRRLSGPGGQDVG